MREQRVVTPFTYLIKLPWLEICRAGYRSIWTLSQAPPLCFFFFKKESWLFWCPDSSFFIMYLCCHILVQNQLTSALWVSNICQALRCWLLWRYIEITHSENMNWQCKTPDVNMTALSICSDITFLLWVPAFPWKRIERSALELFFDGERLEWG